MKVAEKKFPVLPDPLRLRIRSLFKQGFSNESVVEAVRADALPFAQTEEQLKFCIRGIRAADAKEKRADGNSDDNPVRIANADDPEVAEAVKREFEKFRDDPSQQFRVRLRRHRAKEIRSLMANPEDVDLNIFNRDVWWFETATKLDGQDIKGEFLGTGTIRESRLETFEKGLVLGKLELHGNYTWGSGTHVYAPMIKSDSDKLENVRNAVKLLNDKSLEPISKAEKLMELPGFGENISTGLVMMFHPADFGIYNQKSKEAVKILGRDAGTLEAFEKAIDQVKNILGAEDFLELDWFFYLITEGVIKILPNGDDLDLKIKKWKHEHASERRIEIRREFEAKAKQLLENKIGDFSESDLRQFFEFLNKDYSKGKVHHSRFSMAYTGSNLNALLAQLDEVNKWIVRIWKAARTELESILDEFYSQKPIKNAGTAFPSVILYLRDSSNFNLCFKKMEQGLRKLTGFTGSGYNGAYYFNYNDQVNRFKHQYNLTPQELDIILCLDHPDGPIPNVECPFSSDTFDLLRGLHENPSRKYYEDHKDLFRTELEEPFQEIFTSIGRKFPPAMANQLEMKKGLFSRIIKNDWGKGGAWSFYWGAFYPRGGKRIEDAQLFLWINKDRLEFGFYIGQYGDEQKKRFLKNCQANQNSLHEILADSLADDRFLFGNWQEEGIEPPKEIRELSWGDWIQNPGAKGIHVAAFLPKEKVLSLNEEQFINEIYSAYSRLFPLMLLAVSEDPMPAIAEYLDPPGGLGPQPLYTLEECAADTGFPKENLARWVRAIERKGQAVFYGPPGTGKTYVAERLGRHLIGGGDGFMDLIQFHPAYAYEDFVQGIRPKGL
jgi:hypothetical protein